ncbi:MAG: restriction endonuclease subunit S, partial [Elainellaceae cyanobacterium]
MNNISKKRLGDILNFKRGYDLPLSKREDGIYPVISSSGISGYHSKYKVEGEGVITGRYGTLGEVYYLNGKYWPHNTTLYITDYKSNHPKYVYYLLKCLGNLKTSDKSAVPGINRNDLHEVIVPFICGKQQMDIAKVLSDLDSKIELNNNINTELEAMAKLIYDYWFLQFDFPDENGQPYKSSGGKMFYNKELKREIPEGWEVNRLGDLGNFKNGVNYNPSNPGEIACPIINVRNISASSYFLKNEDLDIIYLRESDVRKYSVNDGSIIIARSGIPGATRLISDFEENTLYCGFAIHYELADLIQKIPVFFYLKSSEEIIRSGSGGTILKNVNQAILNDLKVTLPKKNDIIRTFNDKINPVFGKMNLIQKENQKLTELRDWLLPMLMNGQVTVGNSYEQEEEKLGMVAEPGEVYQSDKEAIDALFETINHDYETAVIQLLTERRFGFTYGKKYTHKMFSNIEMLNTMLKFKDLAFEEKGWGMFSKAVAKTIDAQKFIYFHRLDYGAEVLKVRPNAYKDVMAWMTQEENKPFVTEVENMLTIYEKPLINKEMDRIELFNT